MSTVIDAATRFAARPAAPARRHRAQVVDLAARHPRWCPGTHNGAAHIAPAVVHPFYRDDTTIVGHMSVTIQQHPGQPPDVHLAVHDRPGPDAAVSLHLTVDQYRQFARLVAAGLVTLPAGRAVAR